MVGEEGAENDRVEADAAACTERSREEIMDTAVSIRVRGKCRKIGTPPRTIVVGYSCRLSQVWGRDLERRIDSYSLVAIEGASRFISAQLLRTRRM